LHLSINYYQNIGQSLYLTHIKEIKIYLVSLREMTFKE